MGHVQFLAEADRDPFDCPGPYSSIAVSAPPVWAGRHFDVHCMLAARRVVRVLLGSVLRNGGRITPNFDFRPAVELKLTPRRWTQGIA